MFNSFRLALATVAILASALPAAADDWSGCHAGVDVGAARAQSNITDLPYAQGPYAGMTGWNSAGSRTEADSHGGTVGVSLGCDRQLAPLGDGALVLGGLVDITSVNAGGNAAFSGSGRDTVAAFELNSAASLRLRAGYAQGTRLFYMTGGIARGDLDISVQDLAPPAEMQVSGGRGRSGWVVGLGMEWRFAPNRSLDASLLHYDFGALTATGPARDPVGAFPRFKQEVAADMLRLGMNWRF